MKINHILLTLSIVIISLLVIGAASASENGTDAIEASDFEEVLTVETNLENTGNLSQESENEPIIAASENESTIAASENEPVISNAVEDNVITADSSTGIFDWSALFGGNGTGLNWTALFGGNNTGNGTGFNWGSLFGGNGTGLNWTALFGGNGTGLNWTALFGGNGTGLNWTTLFGGNGTGLNWTALFGGNGTGFNISGLINGTKTNTTSSFDISSILDIFTKKDSINSTDLTTYYDKTTKFKVTVMSGNKPLTSGNVVFTINNKRYVADIKSDGTAVLSLQKLKPGTYYITSAYGQALVQNKIVIKKSIITKNVSKKYKKAGKFTVKVLNNKGKVQAKQTVKIKLNGKTYTAKTKSNGIATFKLPKNLKVGKYTIKTTCKGLTISNKLTVKK